jgi:hypothetical protein
MSHTVQAKRAPPAKIASIVIGDQVIAPVFQNDDKGFAVYLVSKHRTDGHQVWKTRLFERRYDPAMERDVQEIHLKSLTRRGDTLVAVDEKGHRYEVKARTGAAVRGIAR